MLHEQTGFIVKTDRTNKHNKTNKINYAVCSWSYIGETGRRPLETRKKEHERNVKRGKPGSNIVTFDHKINFDLSKILDKATY